jgi:hypothetical protein
MMNSDRSKLMQNIGLLIFAACLAAGPATAPTSPPPAPQDVNLLIAQLGHDDFSIREAAAKKLIEIGKPALESLRKAAESPDDPETQARAQQVIKRIVERPVPGGPVSPQDEVVARSIRISTEGGIRQIEVKEQSRSISISEGEFGIKMTVGAVENGRQINEVFEAKDANDLKRQSPDAFTLYDRWGGHQGQMNPLVRGAQNIVIRGPVFIGGQGAFPFALPPDPIDELRDRVVGEMHEKNIAEADRKQVQELLEQLQQVRGAQAVGAGDAQKQLKEQFVLSDKLREKIESLKLGDPGEALPPPAKWRLGVQLAADEGRVMVASVAPESRAERIGLRTGDLITKLNGKDVAGVAGLKESLKGAKEPITLLVVREEKEVTLEEKK